MKRRVFLRSDNLRLSEPEICKINAITDSYHSSPNADDRPPEAECHHRFLT
jgi:hypothetical protein